MPLPMPPNTTCDVYRFGSAPPPAAPDVAGVRGFLTSDYERRLETGESEVAGLRFTHLLYVDLAVDIREGGLGFSVPFNADRIYVPDQNGTLFSVVRVERRLRNSVADHKLVYLDRGGPAWPTNHL